jgi:hypothetical protein
MEGKRWGAHLELREEGLAGDEVVPGVRRLEAGEHMVHFRKLRIHGGGSDSLELRSTRLVLFLCAADDEGFLAGWVELLFQSQFYCIGPSWSGRVGRDCKTTGFWFNLYYLLISLWLCLFIPTPYSVLILLHS